ncbi:hypothetical protein ACX9NE_18885 [Mycobacterium sp. ML4]
MAMRMFCPACGNGGEPIAGWVNFADYDPSWKPITDGWHYPTNDIGLEQPPGVGCFCSEHLQAAEQLSGLPALEAVGRLKAMPFPCAVGGCGRDASFDSEFRALWNVPWEGRYSRPRRPTRLCAEHFYRAEKMRELPATEILRQLSTGATIGRGGVMLPPCGVGGCRHRVVGSVQFTEKDQLFDYWRITWWFCRKHRRRAEKLQGLPSADALGLLSTARGRLDWRRR